MNPSQLEGAETGQGREFESAGHWRWVAIAAGTALVVCSIAAWIIGSETEAESSRSRTTIPQASEPAVGDDAWLAHLLPQIAAREYHAGANDSGLQAPNRAHDFRTYFDSSGIRVHDRTAPGNPALFALSLVGLGRGESLHEVPEGVVESEGARVEILRGENLVEWFVNGPNGLEQGFTLAEKPAGEGPLVVELAVAGARPALAGDAVEFESAGRRLRYGKLFANDADGDLLASRFELAGSDRLRIVVEDAGAAYPVVIDPLLTATADARFESDQDSTNMGESVASAGDVNGDGFGDVIVGASRYDNGQNNEGAAFVFLGSAAGLTDGNPASAHAQLESDQADALMGVSVASAGDVNGDGFGDVIVGADQYDNGQNNEGAAFVFLGSALGLADGNPASAHAQLEGDQISAFMGFGVASAGDVNGDGFGDVIVGAHFFDNGQENEGAAFVFLGSALGLADGNPASAHAQLESNQAGAFMGFGVASAGDVNGDGFGDVIVGAHFFDNGQENEGAAFVFLGSALGLVDGNPASAHAQLESNQVDEFMGWSVASAGDVNGDGFGDVIVGAALYSNGQLREGAAFVFLGSALGVADGNPASAHAQLESNQVEALMGSGVASAGDVNGDGFGDVIVGAERFGNGQFEEGAAFVFSGGPKVWTQSYAFTFADDPTTSSYFPSESYSYNAARLGATRVDRTGTGSYSVFFPGFDSISGGGNVQVSHVGTGGGYCKVSSWSANLVSVRCFNSAGVLSDERFTILYLKLQPGTTSTSYAWANLLSSASYSPDATYAYNASGGAITASRSSAGVYSLIWTGAGAFGSGGGHVQVTAYGAGNLRCKVGGWGTDNVNVLCFNAAGAPTDSQFTVLYIRPQLQDDGLGFAWADSSTSSSYAPHPTWAFNATGGSISATRFGTGVYQMLFDEFPAAGFGNGHAQVTAYGIPGVDTRCSVTEWGLGGIDTVCFDTAGNFADTQYTVLYLRPLTLPEPALIPSLLVAGLAVGAAGRRRNRDRVASDDRAKPNGPGHPTIALPTIAGDGAL